MNKIFDVISGMGILIGIYLFLVNYKGATEVITAIGGVGTKTITSLQGR